MFVQFCVQNGMLYRKKWFTHAHVMYNENKHDQYKEQKYLGNSYYTITIILNCADDILNKVKASV